MSKKIPFKEYTGPKVVRDFINLDPRKKQGPKVLEEREYKERFKSYRVQNQEKGPAFKSVKQSRGVQSYFRFLNFLGPLLLAVGTYKFIIQPFWETERIIPTSLQNRDPDEVLLDAMKYQKIFHDSHSEFFYGKSESNENNGTNENIKSSAFDFSGQNKNL